MLNLSGRYRVKVHFDDLRRMEQSVEADEVANEARNEVQELLDSNAGSGQQVSDLYEAENPGAAPEPSPLASPSGEAPKGSATKRRVRVE